MLARAHVRFHGITQLDVDVLHAVVLEGLARDAGVLFTEFKPDDLTVLADRMGPDHGAETDVHSEFKNYIYIYLVSCLELVLGIAITL